MFVTIIRLALPILVMLHISLSTSGQQNIKLSPAQMRQDVDSLVIGEETGGLIKSYGDVVSAKLPLS